MRGICKNCRKNAYCSMPRIPCLHSDWLNMTVIIVVMLLIIKDIMKKEKFKD